MNGGITRWLMQMSKGSHSDERANAVHKELAVFKQSLAFIQQTSLLHYLNGPLQTPKVNGKSSPVFKHNRI